MAPETQPAIGWRTRQLRLTAFPVTVGQPLLLARDWWNAITGNPPEGVITEPRNGIVRIIGACEDAPLAMAAEVGRLDLVRPFDPGMSVPVPHQQLPLFADAIPPFVTLVNRWLARDSDLDFNRVALGATLQEQRPGIEECRETVNGCLPAVDMRQVEPRDFSFQVNRRRSSRIAPDLVVNRIAKWSIPSASAGTMAVLEVDLNSDPGRAGRLEHAAGLFAELAGYAEEIARTGDRP